MNEFGIFESPHNKPVRTDFSLNEVGALENDSQYQDEVNEQPVVDQLKLDNIQVKTQENGTFLPTKQNSENQQLQKQESDGQNSKPADTKDQDKSAIGEQFNKQKQELRFDDMDYDQNVHFLFRIIFIHLIKLSVKIKKAIVMGYNLGLQHLPRIKENHKVEKVTDDFYDDILMLKATNKFQPFQIFKKSIKLYKAEIFQTFVMCFLDAGFKLFNSVALNYCIQYMIYEDHRSAYIWGGIVLSSLILSTTFRHGSWAVGQNILCRVRLLYVNALYKKISKLSSYSIKEANLGKVINLISSDLNSTELKGFFIFNMIVAPFIFIGALIILYFRLGPYGLLSVVFLSFVFPMQNYFGKKAAYYTQKRTVKSDERVKLINEAIEGIRLIKMYGWEKAFRQMVEKIRSDEISMAIKSISIQCIEKTFSKCFVLFVATIIFCIIHYTGYELNSAKIFSTIEMLQYIRVNVMLFTGMGISYLFELRIFYNRFIDIISIKETEMTALNIDDNVAQQQLNDNLAAQFSNFNAYWKSKANTDKKEKNQQVVILQTEGDQKMLATENNELIENQIKPSLKNINLSIKKGELLGIVGKIGSGKTTFLQCFLREIPMYDGTFLTQNNCSVAYVEQEPYIFSSTVRDNILFGKSYDEQWYNQVVKQCCLLPDFKEMAKGDQTEIGERGINISGGQKARISLARAVYSKADIYLLDDPLSAVDSKVAKKLFHNCIQGILKNRTVILVTHQIHYTKNCDRIIIFEEGEIKDEGTFQQIEDELKKLAAGQLKFETQSQKSISNSNSQKELMDQINEKNAELKNKEKSEAQNKLQPKQVKDNTKVTLKTYQRFFSIVNRKIFGFPLILLVLFVASEIAFTVFNRGLGYYDSTSDDSKGKLFGFLFGFSSLYLVLNFLKQILLSVGILKGSQILHDDMFKSLTRAPVLFFDQTPGGYLMNKFSNDIGLMDNALNYSANDGLDILFYFLNLMITCCVINPFVIIPAVITMIFLLFFLNYSKDIIIRSKIIDLQFKNPVFQFFQSTLSGVIPIKIYNQKQNFAIKMQQLCNNSTQTNIIYWLVGRFFGVFCQYIATAGSGAGVFIIIGLSSGNPGLAGQSLTYFMMMTDSIQWCLRQLLNVDSVMSSCERGYQMVDQPSEAELISEYDIKNGLVNNKDLLEDNIQVAKTELAKPNVVSQWPKQGNLEFKNVFMRYSKDLNPVLKGLNFSIKQGQKVGCIGRTGAGKSSILQALFRMTEVEQGSQIIFDDQDTAKLGLHTLRQKISIIPQVPFVFAGTIRRNLDPLSLHSEKELWDSLKMVELDQHVLKNCPQQLDTDMTNVSSVFSVGQKQLICLARAILKKNKILVLDEATANVDMETDKLIQKTIREKFEDSSVLTIAHRLNTIADYDKIIVMDQGVVAECDEPFNLLAESVEDTFITKNTMFAQMVLHTGKNNAINIFSNAKNKYLQMHNIEEF
ncbi:hypothetical protein ABPG74_021196 [Tetrahymena malaccensis]